MSLGLTKKEVRVDFRTLLAEPRLARSRTVDVATAKNNFYSAVTPMLLETRKLKGTAPGDPTFRENASHLFRMLKDRIRLQQQPPKGEQR